MWMFAQGDLTISLLMNFELILDWMLTQNSQSKLVYFVASYLFANSVNIPWFIVQQMFRNIILYRDGKEHHLHGSCGGSSSTLSQGQAGLQELKKISKRQKGDEFSFDDFCFESADLIFFLLSPNMRSITLE